MAQCMFPYHVERKSYFSQSERTVPVPCGRCPECLKRRTASWAFRLEMEALNWNKQYFVTLTYNTDHVPISPNGFLTLEPQHVTNFLKRLRRRGGQIKYYMCGEYGTQNNRPHYHLIILGNTVTETDIIKSWYDPKSKKQYGNVFFGKVETASITYTVQYYDKGRWQTMHNRDDREPEYSRMSQGLGKSFLTPEMVQHLLENPDKGFIYNQDGHKIAIPRYYKKRIYDYSLTHKLVSSHPSILIHRDEMLDKKKIHNKAMEKVIEQIEQPEETEELNEARKQAIINYRNKKRKIRKL